MPTSKHHSKKLTSRQWKKKSNIAKYELKEGVRTELKSEEGKKNHFAVLSTIFKMFQKKNLKLR